MDNLELAKECGADTVEVIDRNFESPENPYFTYCFERHQLDEFASRVTADKDAEIERLNALVSMQAEALKYAISDLTIRAKLSEDDSLNIGQGCLDQMHEALSATAETVSSWQSKRDEKVKRDFATWLCTQTCASTAAMLYATSELRAKGE